MTSWKIMTLVALFVLVAGLMPAMAAPGPAPQGPAVTIKPASLSTLQLASNVTVRTLTVQNTGNSNLVWHMAEEPCSTVRNADFEQGPVAWDDYSLLAAPIVLDLLPVYVFPHNGSQVAYLGGLDSEISYIEQPVRVPAGAPVLTYWHRIVSEEYCRMYPGVVYDVAYVRVDGVTVAEYDLCKANETQSWELHTVDLSTYAGQTVVLQFAAETDDSEASHLYIDDVSFQAKGAKQPKAPDPITWLSWTPISSTIPAGSTTPVNVTFDSTGVAVGVHTGYLCFGTNDPAAPLVEIPVTMTVADQILRLYLPVVVRLAP